ncbi:uncharacterized protein [Euphorbia lathyris]|uniref:uncharacterized protein n=1 Tax=Euphorbia lathyris TaxID=212925 RepID=UPI003314250D
MTKHLNRQDSDIAYQGHLPGCIWSVLHILDYHYWHSSKRISSRRKHRRGKHHTICCGYPKTISFEHYADEAQEYLAADAIPLIDEPQITKDAIANPTDRISAKARIKALVAKEMSARSQMPRADSFHRLRTSDSLGGITTDWSNPIIILERSADATESRCPGGFSSETGDKLVDSSLNKSYSDAANLSREISHRRIMECMDVLEVFKINKKMFLEILQDPDVKATNNFHVQLTSNTKARLKKSGSFPLARSPDNRHLKPSTLEHKSRETWSFRKGEKFNAEAKVQQSIEAKSLEDFLQMPKAGHANDTVVLAVSEELDFSSSPLSQVSNKHGRHQSFMGHLKYMMKKIKHGLRESKRQNNQTSSDSLLHRVPSGSTLTTDEKEIRGKLEEFPENPRSCHETSSSGKVLSRGQLSHMRRVSSLNESMDRYARLFEYSSTREGKWHEQKSKSLRLINENRIPETGYRIKSFKRRLSLQDLDSNETTHETEIPTKTVMDCDEITKSKSHKDSSLSRILVDGENLGPLYAAKETELHKNMVEEGNIYEENECPAICVVGTKDETFSSGELHEPEKQRDGHYQDEDIGSTASSSGEHEELSQVSVPVQESCIEDHITDQTTVSKGSEVDCRQNSMDETNSDFENDENPHTMIQNDFLHSEIEEVDDADFNYVKDVLEVSGLIQQGHLGTWHSLEQPLSPTLFKELEVYLQQELEYPPEDVDSNCVHHQLLFDSINEVLLQVYASSLAYFPKTICFDQHQRVCPLPKGSHMVEEVWKRLNWYRSPKLKIDQSLDDIVVRDLGKDESWMNLQLDFEDIALDLEDWIFYEILDEIIC